MAIIRQSDPRRSFTTESGERESMAAKVCLPVEEQREERKDRGLKQDFRPRIGLSNGLKAHSLTMWNVV